MSVLAFFASSPELDVVSRSVQSRAVAVLFAELVSFGSFAGGSVWVSVSLFDVSSLAELLSRSDHNLVVEVDFAALINLLSFSFGAMAPSLPDELLADQILLFNVLLDVFNCSCRSVDLFCLSGDVCLELLDDDRSCLCAEIFIPKVGNAAAVLLSDDLKPFFDGDFLVKDLASSSA